ncbi:ribonuclease H-like domain-containing protein [Tanacetum coccineum]
MQFELKGQFLKEQHDNTFSGSDNDDANKHIEKVLEIVDLFHIPDITQDQVMLRVFLMSLIGAASPCLRNEPAGSIKKRKKSITSNKILMKLFTKTSTRCRSTKTSDGLAAIQAQLINLGREIKKVNEKVQLEVHAAPVSKEDINQKFLRSLPPSWSQIALIMRNKPDIDQTDIDDLYNNLRVYEDEMKSTASGNFGVNTAGGTSSTSQVSSTPGADEVLIDQDDLEELDIRWQVAMLTIRVQRFIQKTRRNLDFKGKQPVTFDKSNVECYNCYRKGHFAKECKSGRNQGKISYGDNDIRNATTNEPSLQALVAQDGLGGYDWSNDFDEPVNYTLMAISSSSSSSSSDNEGYELALESLESRILRHEKNELAWGEKYEFQNYELKCREVKIDNLKMELENVVKERDELKVKIEKWEESSKGLNKILNSQMSAKDKNGLGYGT